MEETVEVEDVVATHFLCFHLSLFEFFHVFVHFLTRHLVGEVFHHQVLAHGTDGFHHEAEGVAVAMAEWCNVD